MMRFSINHLEQMERTERETFGARSVSEQARYCFDDALDSIISIVTDIGSFVAPEIFLPVKAAMGVADMAQGDFMGGLGNLFGAAGGFGGIGDALSDFSGMSDIANGITDMNSLSNSMDMFGQMTQQGIDGASALANEMGALGSMTSPGEGMNMMSPDFWAGQNGAPSGAFSANLDAAPSDVSKSISDVGTNASDYLKGSVDNASASIRDANGNYRPLSEIAAGPDAQTASLNTGTMTDAGGAAPATQLTSTQAAPELSPEQIDQATGQDFSKTAANAGSNTGFDNYGLAKSGDNYGKTKTSVGEMIGGLGDKLVSYVKEHPIQAMTGLIGLSSAMKGSPGVRASGQPLNVSAPPSLPPMEFNYNPSYNPLSALETSTYGRSGKGAPRSQFTGTVPKKKATGGAVRMADGGVPTYLGEPAALAGYGGGPEFQFFGSQAAQSPATGVYSTNNSGATGVAGSNPVDAAVSEIGGSSTGAPGDVNVNDPSSAPGSRAAQVALGLMSLAPTPVTPVFGLISLLSTLARSSNDAPPDTPDAPPSDESQAEATMGDPTMGIDFGESDPSDGGGQQGSSVGESVGAGTGNTGTGTGTGDSSVGGFGAGDAPGGVGDGTGWAGGGSLAGGLGSMSGKKRGSRYVTGPGSGQSDDIPAQLSDGEYVIDADTVAALGDGSNSAGARRLDEMRKNIRKHKRSAPADKIPPKAKRPEQYMKRA